MSEMTAIRKSKSHETILWLEQCSEGGKAKKDEFENSTHSWDPTHLAVYVNGLLAELLLMKT